LAALFAQGPAAVAQTEDGGATPAGDAGATAGLLLGAALVLLLCAGLVAYGVPARRRRRASRAQARSRPAPRAADPPVRAEVSFTSTGTGPSERATPSLEPAGSATTATAPLLTPVSDRLRPTLEFDRPPAARAPADVWVAAVDASGGLHPAVSGPMRPAVRPRAPRTTQAGMQRALGYTTFPERKRAVSPESRYQARRIQAACEARGLVLHKLVGDLQSYSGPDLERPGLAHAFELLAAGEASCIVVTGLGRLSGSAASLGMLIDRLGDIGARLVVIDIDLDTSTEEGRLAARALVRVGSLERRSGQEPRHEEPRAAGRDHPGSSRLAVADRPLLQRRIATMRASGMTLQAIADTLNSEGVPTVRGGAKWRPSSVQAATGYKRPGRHSEHHNSADG
jgi:DNA invertase Pin-like site-specific DNA recombinase